MMKHSPKDARAAAMNAFPQYTSNFAHGIDSSSRTATSKACSNKASATRRRLFATHRPCRVVFLRGSELSTDYKFHRTCDTARSDLRAELQPSAPPLPPQPRLSRGTRDQVSRRLRFSSLSLVSQLTRTSICVHSGSSRESSAESEPERFADNRLPSRGRNASQSLTGHSDSLKHRDRQDVRALRRGVRRLLRPCLPHRGWTAIQTAPVYRHQSRNIPARVL